MTGATGNDGEPAAGAISAPPAESPRGRATLTRERVLVAAVALADASGLEGLTMRRLGRTLGVKAMSLYNHVANKDDLLDGMVNAVVAEIDLPTAGGDWRPAMRQSALSAHDVLLRHPWASNLLLRLHRVLPARLQYMDAVLGCLRTAGFSAEMTHHAFHALDGHILGYTLQEVSFPYDTEQLAVVGAELLASLPVGEYPHLAEHVGVHLDHRASDLPGGFEFGLDLILDGLERFRGPGRHRS